MPIEHAIWTVGEQPTELITGSLATEQLLERMIVSKPAILSSEWMLIGQQEPTPFAGRIDLMAIAPDGALVLIELKRNKTPREIVAQALDYAAWVETLTADKIAQIYQRFSNGGSLDAAFEARFGTKLDEEGLNQTHQIIIVAAELDHATERIIKYLNERNIAINVLFFQVFQSGAGQLLSRAWLIDPGETQANAASRTRQAGEKGTWNGEFYVSFGEGDNRTWEEARKYGFISAGGGRWYSKTLELLEVGDLVWVRIPATGYVGVGRVTTPVQSAKDFQLDTPSGLRSCLEVLSHSRAIAERAGDPDRSEYFVGVQWLDTVPASEALDEVGLFGNQNSVCKPQTPKWRHTVDRLKTFFRNWDADSTAALRSRTDG